MITFFFDMEQGHARTEDVERLLREDITGIFDRRYKKEEHEIIEEKFVIQESEIENSYGTVLAAVCFVSFIVPLYSVDT